MKKGAYEDGVVYHAGFPNAGEDQRGGGLSLDALVIKHRASTFFWRLDAALPQLYWPAGSIIVVDRSVPVRDGRLVVAIVDEAFVVCRYRRDGFCDLKGARIQGETRLWGVITYVVQGVGHEAV